MSTNPVRKGRFKAYIKHDYQSFIKGDSLPYEDSLVWDLALSALTVGYLSMVHSDRYGDISTSEFEIWNQITDRIKGKFFIATSVPTLIEVLAKLTDMYSLNIEFWKTANNVVLASVLVTLYRILRKSSVSVMISFLVTIMFSQISSFQDLIYTLNFDSYHLLALTLLILHWRKFQASKDFSVDWYMNITLVSMSLIFVISGKFIGLVSWIWLIIVSLKSLWIVVGDLDVKNRQLFAIMFCRLLFFVVIPLMSLWYSYSSLIGGFTTSSNSIAYMSSSFQHYSMSQHNDIPSSIIYGSSIRLRHVNSLGGYLSALEIPYPKSNDTLVTVSDDPDDEANFWIIESNKGRNTEQTGSNALVKQTDKVKLRNKKTGQLLRASEEKPPISDKEYDKRISVTGDSDYQGDQDELWKIEIQGKASFREVLRPFKQFIVLKNPARRCSLLSHEIKIPHWGDRRQEVLCVDPARVNRALFYIDFVSSPEAGVVEKYKWAPEYPFYKLAFEYVVGQFRLNKRQNIDNTSMSPPDCLSWPILFDNNNQIGKILWITSTVSVGVYTFMEAYSWLSWNIFEDTLLNTTANQLMKREVTLEAFLGWILHLYIFTYSLHRNLSVNQYMPSLLFAVIILSQFSVL